MLRETASASENFSQAFRALAQSLDRPSSRRPRRGRPRRDESRTAQLVSKAPFPELVLEPAHKLPAIIRKMQSVELLREAHEFELKYDRRKSVLDRIEERLRLLGAPLGGPDPVWEDYDKITPGEIMFRLESLDRDRIAQVYAFEHYNQRRGAIMERALELGGSLCHETVKKTSPRAEFHLPEPFPGYRCLSASTSDRARVREVLAKQSKSNLVAALEYELRTRNRVIMIEAIKTALISKTGSF